MNQNRHSCCCLDVRPCVLHLFLLCCFLTLWFVLCSLTNKRRRTRSETSFESCGHYVLKPLAFEFFWLFWGFAWLAVLQRTKSVQPLPRVPGLPRSAGLPGFLAGPGTHIFGGTTSSIRRSALSGSKVSCGGLSRCHTSGSGRWPLRPFGSVVCPCCRYGRAVASTATRGTAASPSWLNSWSSFFARRRSCWRFLLRR